MSVKMVVHWSETNLIKRLTCGLLIVFFERSPHRIVMYSVKCLCKIDRCDPHVHPPFPAFLPISLYVTKWSVVWTERLNPP